MGTDVVIRTETFSSSTKQTRPNATVYDDMTGDVSFVNVSI